MKNSKSIFLVMLFLGFGCKSQKDISQLSINKQVFNYFRADSTFEIKITSFYQSKASCGTEGLPYALLIGKTNNKALPDTVSILSYCDKRIFSVGNKVTIEPTKNPTLESTLKPIFIVKDTMIDHVKTHWIIGSEYQSTWGRPEKE